MKPNILSKSNRLFTIARFQGMSSIITDSPVAKSSSILLFYSIVCAILVTITLQWALYELFARLYSNTEQEVVLTVLVSSKYIFLEWIVMFGYLSQIVQRNVIADVLNEAIKIENYLIKFRLNRCDEECRYWNAAKSYSNWFQILTISCSFMIGCLMYTNDVEFGDVLVFIVTTYCQIMPTILSSMYFFYVSLSFKFYRAINRKIHSFKNNGCDYHQVDRLNCLFNAVTKYTDRVFQLFSIQILATLFYASALILVEVFFLYYNIRKFSINKYLFELYGDLVKNFGLISCFVVEIYFICTITDLAMSEAQQCATTLMYRNSWNNKKKQLFNSMEILYLNTLLQLPEMRSCSLLKIDKKYILSVTTSIISQAIIIIQFKINENKGQSTSGYRSGWNMEGLMKNKILNLATTLHNETS